MLMHSASTWQPPLSMMHSFTSDKINKIYEQNLFSLRYLIAEISNFSDMLSCDYICGLYREQEMYRKWFFDSFSWFMLILNTLFALYISITHGEPIFAAVRTKLGFFLTFSKPDIYTILNIWSKTSTLLTLTLLSISSIANLTAALIRPQCIPTQRIDGALVAAKVTFIVIRTSGISRFRFDRVADVAFAGVGAEGVDAATI